MLNGAAAADVLGRMLAVPTLDEALAGADWVQENAPEDLEIKRALWLRASTAWRRFRHCILASSTSAIVPSQFTESLAGRDRCLICHPINPPYLIPAVELVPAPWTSPETMARAEAVIRGIGQAPIVMQRELDGFVMNRMQGALLEEAFRLVADGYCTIEDVDIGLKDGPGPALVVHGSVRDHRPQRPGGRARLCRALPADLRAPVPVDAAARRLGRAGARAGRAAAPRQRCRPTSSPSASAGATAA